VEESKDSASGLEKHWVALILEDSNEEISRLSKTLKQLRIREIARQGIFGHLSVTKIVERLEATQEVSQTVECESCSLEQ